ncbi:hypothetical protein DRO91_03650 [Candidatus Heimdallarchaeota archaeon]|nr:MAG: hypothetical protein DRP02_12815 [Candidatus Gerdarchaeota archaeon]RLI69745.1 MAG: hypothetical protein DRO63_00215 [Candidatus Gerdarchaeota archaeon]RLI73115.1 MAG: hypothetical protein DRO91_03650 [Candidatus Heimdallarchaeota archaeon]
MFSERNQTSDEDLVLIETQNLQEKCGRCNEPLVLEIYYSKKKYQQKIVCKKCGLFFWKTAQRREEW